MNEIIKEQIVETIRRYEFILKLTYDKVIAVDTKNDTCIKFIMIDNEFQSTIVENNYIAAYGRMVEECIDERDFDEFESCRIDKLKDIAAEAKNSYIHRFKYRLKNDGIFIWIETTIITDPILNDVVYMCEREISDQYKSESVINSLGAMFEAVFLVDMKKRVGKTVKSNEIADLYIVDDSCDIKSVIAKYINDRVAPEYQAGFKEFVGFDNVTRRLSSREDRLSYIYMDNNSDWFQLTILPAVDFSIENPQVLYTYKSYNFQVTKEEELRRNENILAMLANDYYFVIIADLNKDTFEVIRERESDREFTECFSSFTGFLKANVVAFVAKDYRKMVRSVYNINNIINEFDEGRSKIELTYEQTDGWVYEHMIPMSEYSPESRIVLYAVKNYSKEKAQEEAETELLAERNNLQKIYDLLGDQYFSIQILNLGDNTLEIFKSSGDSPYTGIVNIPSDRNIAEYIEYGAYEEDVEYIMQLFDRHSIETMFTEERESRQIEYRRYINDEIKWITMCVQVLKIVDGKAVEVIFAAHNTDEARLEAMKKQEENMRLLTAKKDMGEFMQAMSENFVGVFVVNLYTTEVRILKCQDEFSKLLMSNGIDFMVTMQQYAREMVDEKFSIELIRFLDAGYLINELNNSELPEIIFRKKDGEWVTLSIYKTLSYSEFNPEMMWVFGNSDEREKSRELLEKALEEAEKASKAKTQFFSNMSHDIRTPMNAIIGMINIAKKHLGESDRILECLDQIEVSSSHLLQLINNVLDMTSIESGKTRLNEGIMSLIDLLNDIWVMVNPIAVSHSINLKFNSTCIKHTVVVGDELRLKQVLINLLTNSIRYTDEGGKVSLDVEEKLLPGNLYADYRFVVNDNGRGMSKEFVKRIFEPFEREHNSTESSVEGTGLGMTITRNFVKLMKGRINIDSTLGKGTRISVDIRMLASPKSEYDDEITEIVDKLDIAGCKVLVVEDHIVNMNIMKDYLEDAGVIMTSAVNGAEAVQIIKNCEAWEFDLILMDIQMPVMNGMEATREIRRIGTEYTSNVPIYALTANAFAEDVKMALDVGMNGHISKPVQIEKLYSIIRRILV